ncbi:asparaginase domain-containing protein [Costertonia aggregata]|uniref:Asparaginase n=1 Tax=Costertonia aggregata TaxID=343403 RepID=A0A7H9AMS2_9FLAO|nr:asparaginase domain-containing protein [Costertonia aggregata]QLG44738.1 asparaginase [Costertonia aggregata]
MKIRFLTTGGTIAGLDYELKKKTQISIEDFFRSANVSFFYKIESAFEKDSRFISDADRDLLVDRIGLADENKIIVTHGTLTMVDTAKYIGKFNLKKTIVIVGSFVLGSSKDTDAPFNLGYAICSLQFLKPDVYVAMNGCIFHWNNVTKNLVTNKFEQL